MGARVVAVRLAALIPVLLGLSVLSFGLLAIVPGDPVTAMLGLEADPAAVAALRTKYALDAPLPVRFAAWLGHALQGDLGRSIQTGRPVLGMVLQALGPTLVLASAALLLSLLIAVPAGVVAATRRNRAEDLAVSAAAMCGMSLPSFWLGILLILGLSIRWPLLPSSGYVSPLQDPAGALRHLALPALTLGAALAAATMRMVRSAMLEVLPSAFVRTARAKGLPSHRVVWRHALRPALMPVVAVGGLQRGQLLGGGGGAETGFAWPGIGQGAILATATLLLLVNLVTDLLYALLDPRGRAAA